ADFFEIRDKALIAHRTQIDPDGGWFRVSRRRSPGPAGQGRTPSPRPARARTPGLPGLRPPASRTPNPRTPRHP
ncbi:hypothetical protein ABZ554_45920, partial [Streptomyces sp. NPDC020125]|uniref:hypothetical protein n=1 Tax=Streptomyces sp. NPDC020125 TaxID=3154593 RepID=UPI003406332D